VDMPVFAHIPGPTFLFPKLLGVTEFDTDSWHAPACWPNPYVPWNFAQLKAFSKRAPRRRTIFHNNFHASPNTHDFHSGSTDSILDILGLGCRLLSLQMNRQDNANRRAQNCAPPNSFLQRKWDDLCASATFCSPSRTFHTAPPGAGGITNRTSPLTA